VLRLWRLVIRPPIPRALMVQGGARNAGTGLYRSGRRRLLSDHTGGIADSCSATGLARYSMILAHR